MQVLVLFLTQRFFYHGFEFGMECDDDGGCYINSRGVQGAKALNIARVKRQRNIDLVASSMNTPASLLFGVTFDVNKPLELIPGVEIDCDVVGITVNIWIYFLDPVINRNRQNLCQNCQKYQ